MPLFDRLGRRLKLTPLGETLLDSADQAVRLRGYTNEVIRSARGEPSGPLRIAANTLTVQELLAPVLGDYATDYPKGTVELHAAVSERNPIVGEFDIVFRAGRPDENHLVARRIS